MAKISIVVPVYFNEPSLPSLFDRLFALTKANSHEFEFIFVDDGSKDNSHAVLKSYAEKDKRVKVIKLSRNFGSFVATLAGIRNMTGDCVTVISADLQDPPEMILDMVKEWQLGYKIVLGVRESREDPFISKVMASLFYKLMKRFAMPDMPLGGFDFFLIDKKVAGMISQLKEKNTSLAGLILWMGFERKILYYARKKREHGRSMWTFSKRFKFFIDSFTGFSYFPLRLASFLGIFISLCGFLYVLLIFYMYFFLITPPPGWSAMMVIILFTSGIQLLMLGVIGEYLWRNFDETRKRPVYIIDETVGVDDPV